MISDKEMKQCIVELKKIFPEFVNITGDWLVNAHIHGHKQSKSEKKILKKFTEIMKKLEVMKK